MCNDIQSNSLDTLFNRKSVRDYTGEAITKEHLDMIIRAAMSAPSAMNLQPWNFILVTERAILNQLSEGLPYAQMLLQAGAAIVVCGTPDINDLELSDYWIQDCSAASENILIAVEYLNLGAVWTGVYPRKERIEYVKKALQIPSVYMPLNVIAIGHPLHADLPKDKYDPEKIHREKW